ncbi:MAG: hypothetical protein V4456_12615 [Bacteroidota bacterium]
MEQYKIGELDGSSLHAGDTEGIGLVQMTGMNKYLVKEMFTRKPLPPEVRNFNPDTHVIVTKEQLDLSNQLKQLAGLAGLVNKVESISEGVDYIKSRYTKSTAEDLKKADIKSDKVEDLTKRFLKKKR